MHTEQQVSHSLFNQDAFNIKLLSRAVLTSRTQLDKSLNEVKYIPNFLSFVHASPVPSGAFVPLHHAGTPVLAAGYVPALPG